MMAAHKPTDKPATMSNAMPQSHASHSHQNGYIVVMTRDELESLADILDNPFLPLNDLQKALFLRGYRLVRV